MLGILGVARARDAAFDRRLRQPRARRQRADRRGARAPGQRARARRELAEVERDPTRIRRLVPVVLARGAPAIGKTLAELDLRAKTGASVLAIRARRRRHRQPVAATSRSAPATCSRSPGRRRRSSPRASCCSALRRDHSSSCMPISITRSIGIPKYPTDDAWLRDKNANSRRGKLSGPCA